MLVMVIETKADCPITSYKCMASAHVWARL